MALADVTDWLAVVEADQIAERLRLRSDLYFARPFSKEVASEAASQREIMGKRFDALLMSDADAPQETGDDFWNSLKRAKLYAVKGGKSNA